MINLSFLLIPVLILCLFINSIVNIFVWIEIEIKTKKCYLMLGVSFDLYNINSNK